MSVSFMGISLGRLSHFCFYRIFDRFGLHFLIFFSLDCKFFVLTCIKFLQDQGLRDQNFGKMTYKKSYKNRLAYPSLFNKLKKSFNKFNYSALQIIELQYDLYYVRNCNFHVHFTKLTYTLTNVL